MANFDDAIEIVLKDEGGLENIASDPGEITNMGISLRFYKTIKENATSDDIKSLTKDMAKAIYRKYFWEKGKYNLIANQAIATRAFDLAVNIGIIHANKLLQQSANIVNNLHPNLEIDGILGARSLLAINKSEYEKLLQIFKSLATEYYTNLVKEKPTLQIFLGGWVARLNR